MRILIVEDEQKVARTRIDGQTGLELPIAKWAVEINAGHIVFESSQKHDSLFTIVLPNK